MITEETKVTTRTITGTCDSVNIIYQLTDDGLIKSRSLKVEGFQINGCFENALEEIIRDTLKVGKLLK